MLLQYFVRGKLVGEINSDHSIFPAHRQGDELNRSLWLRNPGNGTWEFL